MDLSTLASRGFLCLCRKAMFPALTAGLFFLVFCLNAYSQLNYGRIFGGVTDQSGGAVVGATVTVIDVQRGVSRPLTTDSAGEYSAPSLIPGTYTVRAEAKGFKTIERTDIVVGVGQDVRVDLIVQPGEQTQTITVSGEAPLINTTNAQLGGNLSTQTMEDMPINGRQYKTLLGYRPGMATLPGQGNNKAVMSNGTRPEAQGWMLDGLYELNVWSGAVIVGGNSPSPVTLDQSTILPVDAIQEINVMQNPKPEYGWKTGAQVNVGLKSGTNNIHGTAFAFGRDTSMDAKNAFLPATLPAAIVNLEQFGGSVGGPIKKDRVFYFGSYEGQRVLVGSPKTVQIPSTTAGLGAGNSFPDAIAGLMAAHVTPNQLSLNLAGCTVAGVCNAANGLFGNLAKSATVAIAPNIGGGSDNAIAKIDYHINEHNMLNGEYFFGDGNFTSAASAIQPYWASVVGARDDVVRTVWVWTPNSTWVNEARFGYDYTSLPSAAAECQEDLGQPNYTTQFGFVSGAQYCGFPLITISGFAALGSANSNTAYHFGTVEGADSVSYTRGKHLFKVGGEMHLTRWSGSAYNSSRGTLTFGSVAAFSGATALEDFLAGVPASGTILIGNSVRDIHENAFAWFAEDDWRLTSRITANLGVRYEYEPPITEENHLLANFDPNTASGLIQETGGHPVYNGDPNNFGPRIGMAWDVTGKGTTVVRAGGGVVFTTLTLLNLNSEPQGAQLSTVPTGFALLEPNGTAIASPGTMQVGTASLSGSQIPWALNTAVYNTGASALRCGNGLGQANPAAAISAANPANPPPCNIGAINQNYREGYVATWTLGIQHAFTNNLSADIGYVGNHGTQLGSAIDANAVTPGAKNGSAAPASENEQIRRRFYSQFPYLGQIEYYTNDADSNYNSLQASLTARGFHSLFFTLAYTLAHTLDRFSSDTNPALMMDSAAPQLDYGNGTWDARNHMSLTASYDVPGRKSWGQLLQGWQINSIIDLLGSFPFNAADTTSDISGTGELLDRWSIVGSPSDFKAGGPSALPCFGASSSSFAKAGCSQAVPAACTAAAAAEPDGPGGTTGTASLNTLGCYMEGNSVIVPPAQGTFGDMARDALRGKGFSEWDGSVTKSWNFKEKLTAQFRAELFNVLNSTQYASPSSNPSAPTSFGQSQSTPNSGSPVIGTGGPRALQLGLKFIF